MRLTPGTRVGPYEVVALLGAGGMAEVYRAKDTRLGREVAIKFVSEALGGRRSFAGALRARGEGRRLPESPQHRRAARRRASRRKVLLRHRAAPGRDAPATAGQGTSALATALDWAAQMAKGLAAAHERGIVHRDLKPENVFVTRDGQVKLLDFGIAKFVEASQAATHHGLMAETVSPSGSATRTGAVLGTPGYMSPEQVRGESVDARTDIFSLGAVVYEMLSGKRAFPGTTVVESGHAILHDEPEPLPAEVPPVVAQHVLHCLEKDRARRFQSASDLAFDLGVVRDSNRPPQPRPRAGARAHVRWPWLLAWTSLAFLAGLGIAVVATRARRVPAATVQAEQLTHRWGTVGAGRFLVDGRVVFSAAFEGAPEELFLQEAGDASTRALGPKSTRLAAVSRTGELAALLGIRPAASGRSVAGTLARLSAVGGLIREVAENVTCADWSPTGELAVAVEKPGEGFTLESPPGKPLFRSRGWISDVRFSSRGDRIAFIHHPIALERRGQVMLVDPGGRSRTLGQVWPVVTGLAWPPGDSEVWVTAGKVAPDALFGIDLDGQTRELYQTPSQLRLEDVNREGAVLLSSGFQRRDTVFFDSTRGAPLLLPSSDWNVPVAISSDRRILLNGMAQEAPQTGPAHRVAMLRRMDGSGAQVLGEFAALDLSLDGHWALGCSDDGSQLLIVPTGTGAPRRLDTRGVRVAGGARFLPDDSGVVFLGQTGEHDSTRLYVLEDNGSAPRRISEASFTGPLLFAYGGRQARSGIVLAVQTGSKTVLVSLRDGRPYPVRGLGESAVPAGWSSDGSLWVRVGLEHPATAELVRLDVRSDHVLQKQVLGPAEPTGVTAVRDVLVDPDGTGFLYSYTRELDSLFVLRGLILPGR